MDTIKDENESKFIITKNGSLGLLAYGDLGLRAWRSVRDKDKQEGFDKK